MKNIINLRISILSLIALLHFSNVNSQNVISQMDSVSYGSGTLQDQLQWQREIIQYHDTNQLYADLEAYNSTLLGNNDQAYVAICWYLASHYLQVSEEANYSQCISNIQAIAGNDTLTQMRILFYEVQARLSHVTTSDTYQISPIDSVNLNTIALSNTLFSEPSCFILQEHYNTWPCSYNNSTPVAMPRGANSNTTKANNYQLVGANPNPSTNSVTIEYKIIDKIESSNSTYIKIYSIINGQVLKSSIVSNHNGNITFDVSDLSSGIYTYSLENNKEIKDVKRITILK